MIVVICPECGGEASAVNFGPGSFEIQSHHKPKDPYFESLRIASAPLCYTKRPQPVYRKAEIQVREGKLSSKWR